MEVEETTSLKELESGTVDSCRSGATGSDLPVLDKEEGLKSSNHSRTLPPSVNGVAGLQL